MHDVFISYAHEDNEYPRYGNRGWVERFYEALKARLGGIRSEEEASVFLDQGRAGITGSSVLTPTLKETLSGCGVLVIVVSPAYLASKWCADELKFFRDSAAKSGGLRAGTKTRVLKVLKVPVATNAFHTGIAELDDAVGYPFCQYRSDGKPIELDPPHGDYMGTEFGCAINALAYDIDAILQSLSGRRGGRGGASSGIPVYLAETSSDMSEYRERIRQELEQFGCTISPASQRLPGPDYAEQVKADLTGARLSIHLVGESYGLIPERSSESIVQMQYRLAGEENARRAEFVRLVWMPPGLHVDEERQQQFVAVLQDDPHLVVTPLEEFKTVIHNQLKPKRPAIPKRAEGAPKSVYLIFDMPDQSAAKNVDNWLFERGFEVLKRKPDAQARSLALNKEFLKASDGVLIYYGNADDDWLQMNLIEFRKVFATGRKRTPPCGVVLADPKRPDKEEFRSHFVRYVIPGFGDFAPDRLEEFVADLESPQAASA
ncbi:MAG TPA: toll/interleukin-1 receptor domain-containing protein [Candidatus Tyrphobacter sp.]